VQALLSDRAYSESLRLVQKHRPSLDRIAAALLERETLNREELLAVFVDVERESRQSDSVGVVRVLPADSSK
jgi:ATP-dependent Zn protease